jgi:hypothetical protein
MTSKEALECLQPFRWDDKKEINVYEVLEELVNRDTPKRIKYENNGIPYCAVCERSYLRDVRGNQNRFCGYCGQRLDWKEKK